MIGKIARAVIAVALVAFVAVKFLPFGYKDYNSELTDKTLVVPNLMMSAGECCEYAASFKTLRSVWALEREIERILRDNYQEVTCANEHKVYYDEENDLTIRAYSAKWKFPLNEVVVSYGVGKGC